MRKKNLLKSIFTCLLSGLLLLLTACNESTRVSELLETGNYSEAVEKYNSLDRPDENLSEEFKLQLQKIYEKFKNGDINYDEAKNQTEIISRSNNESVTTIYQSISRQIDEINDSKIAFETAQAFEKEKIIKMLFLNIIL